MNEEQQLIDLMKDKITNVLFDNFENELSYLAVYALMQVAYDLANNADYFDEVCAETSIFYEEDKELAFEEEYYERIVRLCNVV